MARTLFLIVLEKLAADAVGRIVANKWNDVVFILVIITGCFNVENETGQTFFIDQLLAAAG
ncbi:hypothetical protein RV10_GL002399 [Enterococcus pallens]|nr:hypothetical protein RV10_GL002399 [Enterococcus pallens]